MPGIRGEVSRMANQESSAAWLGSGTLAVFGTPAMLALMEQAAHESVAPFLADGETSVGTHAKLEHCAATPLGLCVRCQSELIQLDGRRLTFRCEAYDDSGLIGSCIQERVIVNAARFMQKAERKHNPDANKD